MNLLKLGLTLTILTVGYSSPALLAQQEDSHKNASDDLARVKGNAAIASTIDSFFAVRTFEQAAISPDGKKVAWVETLLGKDGVPDGTSAILVADASNFAAPAKVTASSGADLHTEGSVAWSPDSKSLAFLSDAASPGQSQIYVVPTSGGTPKQLTHVKGLLAAPAWAPDGHSIAVLFTENVTHPAGPLASEPPETGEIKDAFFEQRLAVVDVNSGELRQVSPEDMHVYEYDWAPDSRRMALTAAHGNGDNNWWIAQLYVLDASASAIKPLYKPTLQIARPAFSPDGQTVAFVEGLMSDEDSVGGDVFTVPASGGPAQNVTPGMKASANWLTWMPDGKILFAGPVGGDAHVATVDPVKHIVTRSWQAPEQVSSGLWGTNLSLAADGKSSAVIRSSLSSPPEIWTGSIGNWKQVTHRNDGLKPGWGETRSIHWKSDGYDVQGWLTYPKSFDSSKKYPMIVRVHGGPGAAVQSNWPDSSWDFALTLSGAGYFVLQPNPRGSFGQGEAFTRANVRDFGYGDFRDIMAGVDEAIRVAPIDPNRLGLTGWSYGGFMTMWGVTQTNRFKAAMAGAGIANYQSYYGENKIDQWMIPFFGKSVYDDPEIYARSSPINFIKKVKTPTLIIVGDSDGECPTPQSYEFWHALKAQGVETSLVVYEHEGHRFMNPAHQRDRIERTIAWFDAHLK